MSQSQYNFNTFQSNQPTIYNQNSNQDVAYTQQQTFQTATQFQYQMPNQESVMMQMNPFQQSFNPVLTINQNQNQPKLKSEDKDLQNIMPNKQSAPKLPKQKSAQKNSKMAVASSSSSTSKSEKMKIQEEDDEEPKIKLDSISTVLNSDPLDLERNSGVPDFIKKLYR